MIDLGPDDGEHPPLPAQLATPAYCHSWPQDMTNYSWGRVADAIVSFGES